MSSLASSVNLCPSFPPAWLALADGTIFEGFGVGIVGETVGEVVFNTSMTGYQEILTDPSYAQQIVTLTYPHIGNVGANAEDAEADRPYAAGLIVKDVPLCASNFRMEESLPEYLRRNGMVAIAGIDTRALTQRLRTFGAQAGAIITGEKANAARALELARAFPGLAGMDLAKEVSTRKTYSWKESEWSLQDGYGSIRDTRFHVVAYDYGVKRNILRLLASRGCRVTVVPAQTSLKDALAFKPNGVFLSNGPGDPEPCAYAIDTARACIAQRIPLFGICLGHQIMGLAVGAKTFKMKFGHHGANHPVQELATGRVFITSQNHGFAVDPDTLPATVRMTHMSLFDGSLQGFECIDAPAFCFQGHPEASPGPHDIVPLFDHFISLMEAQR
ncbi:MAG: glutamine-hydrolyzing carbamoyl-phosphate synthase small subunit [Burkholderiales bacterium]|jgi:carbamoyl-phosphate synthase small subunit|nr:glutamine-hydrolyzing carbamoyl-phosphate synthase small subunit [Burkholderiales bacterium]